MTSTDFAAATHAGYASKSAITSITRAGGASILIDLLVLSGME